MNKIGRFLQSPANWCGVGLSTAALVLSSLGLAQWGATALAVLGYAAGFGVGGLWLGFPKLSGNPWDELEFEDQGDARTSMLNALSAVRQLVDYNPQGRLPASLQTKALDLCKQLATLLDQWERSKGQLSLEESFHARHIALSYLPDALKTYLSIPQQFAMTKVLANGQTAQATFNATLDELSQKVAQLGEDLAAQDAQAFLNHSQFLQEKFKKRLGANPP
ncbi:hypothetical protein [Rhodoferax sp.]|uniref:hypothetical protein n=1 Tax=Rhodoferax sp. TaxID=50421 RepID=UPI00274B661E|nr:hypothetical protein [Rhodoferax sp.]